MAPHKAQPGEAEILDGRIRMCAEVDNNVLMVASGFGQDRTQGAHLWANHAHRAMNSS